MTFKDYYLDKALKVNHELLLDETFVTHCENMDNLIGTYARGFVRALDSTQQLSKDRLASDLRTYMYNELMDTINYPDDLEDGHMYKILNDRVDYEFINLHKNSIVVDREFKDKDDECEFVKSVIEEHTDYKVQNINTIGMPNYRGIIVITLTNTFTKFGEVRDLEYKVNELLAVFFYKYSKSFHSLIVQGQEIYTSTPKGINRYMDEVKK